MSTDRKIAIGILGFIAVAGCFTSQLPETIMEGEPGPVFFPALILAALAILSVMLYLGGGKGTVPRIKTESLRLSRTASTRGALAFFGVFLAGLALMKFAGFSIGMVPALTFMLVMAKWKFPKALIFSVIVIIVVHLAFERLLDIPLPSGILMPS